MEPQNKSSNKTNTEKNRNVDKPSAFFMVLVTASAISILFLIDRFVIDVIIKKMKEMMALCFC